MLVWCEHAFVYLKDRRYWTLILRVALAYELVIIDYSLPVLLFVVASVLLNQIPRSLLPRLRLRSSSAICESFDHTENLRGKRGRFPVGRTSIGSCYQKI